MSSEPVLSLVWGDNADISEDDQERFSWCNENFLQLVKLREQAEQARVRKEAGVRKGLDTRRKKQQQKEEADAKLAASVVKLAESATRSMSSQSTPLTDEDRKRRLEAVNKEVHKAVAKAREQIEKRAEASAQQVEKLQAPGAVASIAAEAVRHTADMIDDGSRSVQSALSDLSSLRADEDAEDAEDADLASIVSTDSSVLGGRSVESIVRSRVLEDVLTGFDVDSVDFFRAADSEDPAGALGAVDIRPEVCPEDGATYNNNSHVVSKNVGILLKVLSALEENACAAVAVANKHILMAINDAFEVEKKGQVPDLWDEHSEEGSSADEEELEEESTLE